MRIGKLAVCFLPILLPAVMRSVEPELGLLQISVDFSSAQTSETDPTGWFAIVNVRDPWSEPSLVQELHPRQTAEVQLPADRYVAVCFLEGLSPWFAEPFSVVSGGKVELKCRMRPLVAVEGRVITTEGEVGGASVAFASLFDPTHRYRLRGDLQSQLAAVFMTTTSQNGTFRLPAPPEHSSQLLVQAPGSAAVLVPFAAPAAGTTRLGDIAMEAGGSARARVRLLGSEGTELVPGGALLALRTLGDPEGRLDRYLRRRWRGSGHAVEWPSLAPGEYELWLRWHPGAGSHAAPKLLTPFRVKAGQEADLEPGSVEVRSAQPKGDLELLIAGTEVETESLRVLASHAGFIPYDTRAVSGGLRVRAAGACRMGAVITAFTDDWVSRPLTVLSKADCRNPTKALWVRPRGAVESRLTAPPNLPFPTELLVRLEGCEPGAPVDTYPALARADDESFWAPVPVGCHDVELLSQFQAQPWQAVQVRRDETRSLSARKLRQAGRVWARLVKGAEEEPYPGALAAAIPMAEVTEVFEGAWAGSPLGAKFQIADQDGWVKLEGLSPGTHALLVSSAGQTFELSSRFEVAVGSEVILDTVPVPEPVRVTVEFPESPGLELIADREFSCGTRIVAMVEPRTRSQGRAQFLLSAGTWTLRMVEVASDNGRQVLARMDVDLAHPEEWFRLDPLPPWPGRVKGERDWSGITLRFSNLDGSSALSLSTDVGAEGRFELRAVQGRYQVDAYDGSYNALFDVGDVAVPNSNGRIEIELPAGSISGVVSGRHGEDHTSISASRLQETASTPTSYRSQQPRNDGSFELRHLTAGHWWVKARAGRRASPLQVVELDEGEAVGGLTLTLADVAPVIGRVRRQEGKVPTGLRGIVYAADGELADFASSPFEVDEEGRFEAATEVVAPTTANVVLLSTSELPLMARRTTGEEAEITLAKHGGSLELEMVGPGAKAWQVFLENDHRAFISVASLADDWAGLGLPVEETERGERFVIPFLEAGHYRVHLVDAIRELVDMYAGRTPSEDAVGSVYVGPGERALFLVE